MALSIKTEEADRLARDLAGLTGETMTQAVATALRERLSRERARRSAACDLPARLSALSARITKDYDRTPVTPDDWDEASGDTG